MKIMRKKQTNNQQNSSEIKNKNETRSSVSEKISPRPHFTQRVTPKEVSRWLKKFNYIWNGFVFGINWIIYISHYHL